MSEPTSIRIIWEKCNEPIYIDNLLTELRKITIETVDVDVEQKCTTVNGILKYQYNGNDSFEIVPNKLEITRDKSIVFKLLKEYDITDYHNIIQFISNHCSYIDEYVKDGNKIVSLSSDMKIVRSNNVDVISDKLFAIRDMKELFYSSNFDTLDPFLFAALIKNFYQQINQPFRIKADIQMIRIKNSILYIKNLLTTDSMILKNYKINSLDDQCLSYNSFKFLNTQIVEIDNLALFEQNMDLKYLSLISQPDIKESIYKCRT